MSSKPKQPEPKKKAKGGSPEAAAKSSRSPGNSPPKPPPQSPYNTSYPIEQSALPGGSKRSEPMRGLEQNMLYGALCALFPRCQWTEEFRFDLVFSLYAVFYLLIQMQNIYRFNFGNWDYVVLMLGSLVLCKRTLCRLAIATWAECRESPPDAPSTNAISTAIKAIILGVLLVSSFVLAHKLYVQKAAAESADAAFSMNGLLALVVFVAPAAVDLTLLAICGHLGGGASAAAAKEPLSLKAASDGVTASIATGVYGSMEAFYIAGVAPVLLADGEMHTFDSWHCQQTSLYILISGLSLTMVHKLSSTVSDFSQFERLGADAKVVGALPVSLSANSNKLYILIAMARFVVLAFLLYGFLTALAHPSLYVCQLLLVIVDYRTIVGCIGMWTRATEHAAKLA